MGTAARICEEALVAFGTEGYDATSLDDLARRLGMAKQTILYWFGSKEALLDAVVDRSGAEVAQRIERAAAASGPGFERVEAVVRAGFRLAARHPAILGLLREVNRLGPPASTRLTDALTPSLKAAAAWLEGEMDAGRLQRADPELLLVTAYAAVTGLAAETEVLRALGGEATLTSLVHRRNELVELLRRALEP